jgi:hypothetical protein
VAQAPAAAVAAAPAAKSGSPILKIVLIVLGVLIFLGLLSAASCVYFYYTHVKPAVTEIKKKAQSFPTQVGTREVRPQPSAPPETPAPPAGPVVDTGVATYPGATPWGGGAQVSGPNATMKTQEYTTSDSLDQVLAFYKDKLGPSAMVTQSGGQAVVQVLGANGETTVAIKPDASTGKTHITINSIGK